VEESGAPSSVGAAWAGDAAAITRLEERDADPDARPELLQLHLGAAGGRAGDAVVDASLDLLACSDIPVLDVAGDPAEEHPRFVEVTVLARALRRRVVARCEPALLAGPALAHLPELLARHGVGLVAPLPLSPAHDGGRAFEGLRALAAAGYGAGVEGGAPRLDLVLRASSTRARGDAGLEHAWRQALAAHGLRFDRLHVLGPDEPVDAGRVAGVPGRSALVVAPDGSVLRGRIGQGGAQATGERVQDRRRRRR
jgi:hypothetical protein